MSVLCAIEGVSVGVRTTRHDENSLRQLRHHSKNAMQRIIIQVLETPALCGTREGRRAADELIRRIKLSTAISDALFGFTQPPQPLPDRVRSLAESLIAFHSDGTQSIDLEVTASSGVASLRRQELILRIVHELIVNALKHGMYMRVIGKLSIELDLREDAGLTLSVTNDGWQIDERACPNEGLGIVRELVRSEGGRMTITVRPHTTFQISFPPQNGNYVGPDTGLPPTFGASWITR